MYFFCDVIISKLGKKGPKVVYHVSRVIERSKSIFDGTLKWGEFVSVTNLSKYCNFTSLSQIGSKSVQTCISYTNGDRKMKINSKGKLEVNHYFLNSLSQNFDFFDFFESFVFLRWPHQPKNGWKRSKLVFHVPMLIGR